VFICESYEPRLSLPSQYSLSDHGGMEGWVDLDGWLRSPIQLQTGLMSINYTDRDQLANHYAMQPANKLVQQFRKTQFQFENTSEHAALPKFLGHNTNSMQCIHVLLV